MDQLFTGPIPTRLNDEEEQKQQQDASLRAVVEKKLIESRTILLYEPVSDKLARHATGMAMVLEEIDPDKPITVMINSPGGHADSGFAIYDILRFVNCPVRTIVNGLCASAAVLVHLAAEKGNRFTLPGSRFLVHQPSTAGRGTASDLDITAQQIIKLRHRYNAIVAEACGVDPEKVLEDAARDFWLDAQEAVEYGLADKIITRRADLD